MTAEALLERRYRRLLLAYSGRYRRRHGAEMIGTMLEMAEPGRSRPSAGEAWHLVASGVRQRFRLPAGRPFAILAAVVMTVVLGVFGAAAGSWIAQHATGELPSRAGARAMLQSAEPDTTVPFVNPEAAPGRAGSMFVGLFPTAHGPDGTPIWTVEQARAGLIAAGWTVTAFAVHPGGPAPCPPTDSTCYDKYAQLRRTADMTAERDGLMLRGQVTDAIGGDDKPGGIRLGGMNVDLTVARSPVYLPVTIAGALLGALIGWLLAAASAYRIRSRPSGSGRLAVTFTGVALTASALPVCAIALDAVMYAEHRIDLQQIYTLHAALRPGDFLGTYGLDGQPSWLIPGCTLVALVAALIAAGALLRKGSEEAPRLTDPAVR